MRDISLTEVIEQFAYMCKESGLLVEASLIKADGKKHRCPVMESRKSKTTGEYKLYARNNTDFPYNGIIKNYYTGVVVKWNILHDRDNFKRNFSTPFLPKNNFLEKNLKSDEIHIKKSYLAYQIFSKARVLPHIRAYLEIKHIFSAIITNKTINIYEILITKTLIYYIFSTNFVSENIMQMNTHMIV